MPCLGSNSATRDVDSPDWGSDEGNQAESEERTRLEVAVWWRRTSDRSQRALDYKLFHEVVSARRAQKVLKIPATEVIFEEAHLAVDVHTGLLPARPDPGLLSVPQGLERSRLRGETDARLSSCVRRCWRSWSCRGVVETTRAWQTWRQEFQIRSCAGCPRHSPRLQLRVGTSPTCCRLPARTRHVPCTVPPSSKSWRTSGTRLHRRVGHRSSTTSPTMCDTLAQNFNVRRKGMRRPSFQGSQGKAFLKVPLLPWKTLRWGVAPAAS